MTHMTAAEVPVLELVLWTGTDGFNVPIRTEVTICCNARSDDGLRRVVGIPDGNVFVFFNSTGDESKSALEGVFQTGCPNMSHLIVSQNAQTVCCLDTQDRMHFFRRGMDTWKEEKVSGDAVSGLSVLMLEALRLTDDCLVMTTPSGLQCFRRQTYWWFGQKVHWQRFNDSSEEADSFLC